MSIWMSLKFFFQGADMPLKNPLKIKARKRRKQKQLVNVHNKFYTSTFVSMYKKALLFQL